MSKWSESWRIAAKSENTFGDYLDISELGTRSGKTRNNFNTRKKGARASSSLCVAESNTSGPFMPPSVDRGIYTDYANVFNLVIRNNSTIPRSNVLAKRSRGNVGH
jgi:hypothetical protein